MVNVYFFDITTYWAIIGFIISLIVFFRYFNSFRTGLKKKGILTLYISLIGLIGIPYILFYFPWRGNNFSTIVLFSLIHFYLYISVNSLFSDHLKKLNVLTKKVIKYTYFLTFYFSISRIIFFSSVGTSMYYENLFTKIVFFAIPVATLNYISKHKDIISWIKTNEERKFSNQIDSKQSKIQDKFSKIKSLLDAGYITKEDYEKKKKDLIDLI